MDKPIFNFFSSKKAQDIGGSTMPAERLLKILLALAVAAALFFMIKRIYYGSLPK